MEGHDGLEERMVRLVLPRAQTPDAATPVNTSTTVESSYLGGCLVTIWLSSAKDSSAYKSEYLLATQNQQFAYRAHGDLEDFQDSPDFPPEVLVRIHEHCVSIIF